MQPSVRPSATRPRGVTLLEALIALLVLSLGMLAVARVQVDLRLQAETARQRTEAVRLADEEIETLRSFAVLALQPGLAAYAAIADSARTVAAGDAGGTAYALTRRIGSAGAARAKTVDVTVAWTDRNGQAQQLGLATLIAGADPALSGALALKRSSEPARGPFGRSLAIPLAAKDLGDGRSALKPVASGRDALLFDNHSGLVVGRCAGVNPALDTRSLRAADLLGCDAEVGRLLSGLVRFSAASPPDAAHPNDPALPLTIDLAPIGGTSPAPWCATEAVMTVRYTVAGNLHIDNLPLAATPASVGAAGWTDSGERSLAYHCVVYAPAGSSWAGRVVLRPVGWHIGSGVGEHRVCRYASDLDGNGAIDANIEHPAAYSAATTALPQQNYLVINSSERCPGGAPIQIAGTPADVFVNRATVQHQP